MGKENDLKHIPQVVASASGREWKIVDHDPSMVASLTYKMKNDNGGMLLKPYHVETEFTRKGRPEPQSNIVNQGRYECAAAALAMLLDENLFHVKRAMGKMHWRNDDSGANDKVIIGATRLLGRDLIKFKKNHITKDIGPCMVTINSLNVKGMGHALTWNGKEILDPNWGSKERKYWGCEWSPFTMKASNALVLMDRVLSQSERDQLDEAERKQDDADLKRIQAEVFKAFQEAS